MQLFGIQHNPFEVSNPHRQLFNKIHVSSDGVVQPPAPDQSKGFSQEIQPEPLIKMSEIKGRRAYRYSYKIELYGDL